jgi:hypothetical protein
MSRSALLLEVNMTKRHPNTRDERRYIDAKWKAIKQAEKAKRNDSSEKDVPVIEE